MVPREIGLVVRTLLFSAPGRDIRSGVSATRPGSSSTVIGILSGFLSLHDIARSRFAGRGPWSTMALAVRLTSMRALLAALLSLLAGCAAMTSVVLLDPTMLYPPTQSVRILLKPPLEPYVEIAKLESRGLPGEPETALLEDARARAGEVGADAIIVIETSSVYQPPIVVYDPWPPYLPWYRDRWRGYSYWYFPPPFPYLPEPMTFPGGNAYTVRTIAIKFKGEKGDAHLSPPFPKKGVRPLFPYECAAVLASTSVREACAAACSRV